MMLRAIIYVAADGDLIRAETACVEYCERHGYQVVALVVGDGDGQSWFHGVVGMLTAHEAELIVVWTRAELPAARLPRLEVVVEEPPPTSHRRRPRPRPIDR